MKTPGKNRRKITKYKRYSFFNIGTLLFGLVFIYMVIMTFMYLTQTHITAYEVRRGSLTGNYRYQALALRTETIVNATQSGSVRYYEREGARTAAGATVCSIDESGALQVSAVEDFSLDEEDEERLGDLLSSFTINFSTSAFQKAYDMKASVESVISEIIEENSNSTGSLRNPCTAPASGFVLYKIDGYETTTEEQLDASMFSQSDYKATNLRSQTRVTAGDPVYKLVTGETWALYFPIDDALRTQLADAGTVRFRFLKDNVTFTSSFSIITNENGTYGKISLDNSLVRYVTDRFLEIELVLNTKTGLKVPTTAITSRSFYSIPEEYVTVNEDSDDEIRLKVEHFNDDGSSDVSYKTATVYKYIEGDGDSGGDYLVDCELLDDGDYIQMENSAKRFQIRAEDAETLYGVYNINKGYAVFREITVIDENEEYCIVQSNNTYSLDAYDYIALDASLITDEQIVY